MTDVISTLMALRKTIAEAATTALAYPPHRFESRGDPDSVATTAAAEVLAEVDGVASAVEVGADPDGAARHVRVAFDTGELVIVNLVGLNDEGRARRHFQPHEVTITLVEDKEDAGEPDDDLLWPAEHQERIQAAREQCEEALVRRPPRRRSTTERELIALSRSTTVEPHRLETSAKSPRVRRTTKRYRA